MSRKSTRPTKTLAIGESGNESTDRERPMLHQQGEDRPTRARQSLIDDDWTRRDSARGRRNDMPRIPEAKERTQPKKPKAVAESKYEPTDYERTVLAKQAERLKDQVRVPRIRFVEDQHGGRRQFDHPDQAIAFALLKEAFGTADDQFANGLLHYLCAVLPIDEKSAYEFPRADALNRAISLIAARKAADEIEAEIIADWAVCRIIIERLLHNVREPLRNDLSTELKLQLLHYQYNPKGEVKIDEGPVLEFSVRYATKLMTLSIELLAAADRHRAIVESSRRMQELSAVPSMDLGKIRHVTPNATRKKANTARARGLNGSAVPNLPQKTYSTTTRGNGYTPS